MGQTDLANYKNIYLQTAREYLNDLRSGYSKLSVNPQDKEVISSIHVSAHSLGGQSQIMKFANIVKSSANIEKISGEIQNKVGIINNDFMNSLKNSLDELDLELSRIEEAQ
jgi:chemotaxis protein histidine kinase CheA